MISVFILVYIQADLYTISLKYEFVGHETSKLKIDFTVFILGLLNVLNILPDF